MDYNGWENYETWCVALWLDNDQSNHEMLREIVHDESMKLYEKVGDLRAVVEEANPLADQASLYTDLLNAALSVVNWREIIKNAQNE